MIYPYQNFAQTAGHVAGYWKNGQMLRKKREAWCGPSQEESIRPQARAMSFLLCSSDVTAPHFKGGGRSD